MSLIEHHASQEPPPHMCFTTDGEWVACPPDLCEAFYLAQENVRLSRQLAGAVEAFAQERQAVLDIVNLYGDETLHKALDDIGWPANYLGGQ